MVFRKKSWINNMPDLDKAALLQLVDGHEDKIGTPREMIYVFMDISNDEQLENLATYLAADGWKIEVHKDPDNKELFIAEAKKSDYEISEENYKNDVALMNRLASMYGIHYDGWYASQ